MSADPIKSAAEIAKSPTTSVIAVLAGMIGFVLYGRDESEAIRIAIFVLSGLGGAGTLVHVGLYFFKIASAKFVELRNNSRYRVLTSEFNRDQLIFVFSCLCRDDSTAGFANVKGYNHGLLWVQDLLEKGLAKTEWNRPDLLSVKQDYWYWLQKNRTYLRGLCESNTELQKLVETEQILEYV